MATVDDYTIAFQCKRLSSDKPEAMQANLADAAEQLVGNRSRYPLITHGLIAVDVTKLINPTGGTVAVPGSHDSFAVRDELRRIAEGADAEFRLGAVAGVDGIVFRATYPAHVEGSTDVETWSNHPYSRYGTSAAGADVLFMLYGRYKSLRQARMQGCEDLRAPR